MLNELKALTNYELTTLPNGTRLITHYRPNSLGVAFGIRYRYGLAYEPVNKRQVSHLAEHMVFKKGDHETCVRSRAEFSQYVEEGA